MDWPNEWPSVAVACAFCESVTEDEVFDEAEVPSLSETLLAVLLPSDSATLEVKFQVSEKPMERCWLWPADSPAVNEHVMVNALDSGTRPMMSSISMMMTLLVCW